MSSFITNGATTLQFRNADLQAVLKTPKHKLQRVIPNASMFPVVQTIGDAQRQLIKCLCNVTRADQGSNAGADSLYSFFESVDPSGVDGLAQTFMFTDSDGDTYQCMFSDPIGGGLREVKKDTIFTGNFDLVVVPATPSDNANCQGWYAAYDMDNNGGDLSSWTTTDAVGDTGSEWSDKSDQSEDGSQSNPVHRPQWLTSQFNSRPGVDFQAGGTVDILAVNGMASAFTGSNKPISIVAVFNIDALAGTDYVIFSVSHSSTSDHWLKLFAGAGGSNNQLGFAAKDGSTEVVATVTTTLTVDTNYIVSLIFDGTTANLYLNGDNTGAADVDFSTVGSITLDQAQIGGMRNGTGTPSLSLEGQIEEIAVFSEALTTQERRAQEFRLSDMSNVSLTT